MTRNGKEKEKEKKRNRKEKEKEKETDKKRDIEKEIGVKDLIVLIATNQLGFERRAPPSRSCQLRSNQSAV